MVCVKLGGDVETKCLVSTETVNILICKEIRGKDVLYYIPAWCVVCPISKQLITLPWQICILRCLVCNLCSCGISTKNMIS